MFGRAVKAISSLGVRSPWLLVTTILHLRFFLHNKKDISIKRIIGLHTDVNTICLHLEKCNITFTKICIVQIGFESHEGHSKS